MAELVVGSIVQYATGSALAGQIAGWVAGAYLNKGNGQHTEGPRLQNLQVQSSTEGAPIPTVYGTSRIAGNVIWSASIKEAAHTQSSGGKGGPKNTSTNYTYSCSFAVGLCEGTITGIRRIWADGILIYNKGDTATADELSVSNAVGIAIYTGSETQEPDPTIEASVGIGSVPGHRGLAYIVFTDLQLEKYGNRIPNITCEVVGKGNENYANISVLRHTVDYIHKSSARAYSVSDSEIRFFTQVYEYNSVDGSRVRTYSLSKDDGSVNVIGDFFVSSLGAGSIYPPFQCIGQESTGFFIDRNNPTSHYYSQVWYYTEDGVGELAANFLGNTNMYAARVGGSNFVCGLDSGSYIVKLDDVEVSSLNSVLPYSISGWEGIFYSSKYVFIVASTSGGVVILRLDISSGEFIDYIIPMSSNMDQLGSYSFGVRNDADILYCNGSAAMPDYGVPQDSLVVYENFSSTPTGYALLPNSEEFADADTQHSVYNIVSDGDSLLIYHSNKSNLYQGQLGVWDKLLEIDSVSLGSIVQYICNNSNVEDIDTSGIDSTTVWGYVRTNPMTAAAALQPLLSAYSISASESDYQLKFSPLTGSVNDALDATDLGASASKEAEPLKITRGSQTELPRRVETVYIDPDGDYQQGNQFAQRVITEN